MKFDWFACCVGLLSACAVAQPSVAATVNYVGSAESGDISRSENWGGILPGKSDTAAFPDGFSSPASGLNLGGALAFGNLSWSDTSGRELDLGGNTLTLDDPSGTSQLSIGANAVLAVKNGTFNVDSEISRFLPSGDYCTLILTNATMNINRPNWRLNGTYGKGFTIRVLKDARLISTGLPNGDQTFPLIGKYSCKFIIDGGFASLMSQRNTSGVTYARIGFNQSWEDGSLEVKNGGILDFTGAFAGVRLTGTKARYSFNDSFLYQTNGVAYSGSDFGVYYANSGDSSKPGYLAMTNSVYKGVRFNYGGKNGNVTFHDTAVDLSCDNKDYAGFFFYEAGGGNRVTVSGNSSFKAKILNWVSSSGNGATFALEGGTFSAPVVMDGTNGVLAVTGGEGNGVITMKGVSNRVEMVGCKWVHTSPIDIAGVSNLFSVAGTACVTGTYMSVFGAGARLEQDGGTVYGGVRLVGNGAVAHLKNGALRYGNHRTEGLQFKHGVTNAVFIVEDSTYENRGNFSGDYKGASSVYNDYGSVYTNCPGSAIEFRGTTPRFMNSSATLYAGGSVYVAMVFGSFSTGDAVTGPVLGTEPLDNPLALRFILPPNGYEEAPLYGNVHYNKDRPIALCGNARIEVDDSAFVRTRDKKHVRIPLIKDEANFSVSGYRMIDIDALNRNNAAHLPKDSCLEYVPADKTVYLKMTNRYGFSVTLR